MSISGPSDIHRRWADYRTTTAPRSLPIGAAPISFGTLKIAERSGSSLDAEVLGRLERASHSLSAAFGTYSSRIDPVFTTTLTAHAAGPATAVGTAARLTGVAGTHSVLQSTLKANTQLSTVRSSSAAIGLDFSSAHSTLASAALGLDLTTPEAKSSLTSTAAVGTDNVDAASTLQSTAEMNAATTSLASSDIALSGSSTSRVQLSGAFTGTASSLTIKVTKFSNGIPGFTPKTIKFDVLDQAGQKLDSYNGTFASGEVYHLGDIGLKVRFTAGTVSANTSATTAVSQTPATVSTTAAFNSGWGAAPLFENFAQVTAGSFSVNGVSIGVAANDSISSVLAKINSSAAGVTATVSGDRVVLTSNSASESNITLAGDTSGFLAATKLSAAVTSRGNLRDDQQALSQTGAFAGIATGLFSVNGVSISVNKDSDSISSVLARINGAGAGVIASFDTASDRIILTSTSASEDPITVSGDTSGFVAAAKLSTATTVIGNVRDDRQVLSKVSQFASVTDGSFAVNGAQIAVDADTDSVTTIVDKINAAGAGVTAVFDSATNRIQLVTATDSEDDILVADDTSGFLAAAGLLTASTVVGSIDDRTQALAGTTPFAAVISGSLSVNGVTVAVDAAVDTFDDVVARINAANAGVTASYDGLTDRLTFTPDVAGAALSIDDGGTGFLAAAHISEGAIGLAVDVDGAFDGSNGAGPLFDPGVAVQAGSFSINGTVIDVMADDTVAEVLTRITESAAGVTATFDADTQLVRLTAKQSGGGAIALGPDSSGFLAAMRLDGTAHGTTGLTPLTPFGSALGSFAEYAGVTAGTVTVNGETIAIDPDAMSVTDLVSALDRVQGVKAILNETTGRVIVSATTPAAPLDITDSSGVLAALGIAAGSYGGAPGGSRAIETQTGTTLISNGAAVAETAARAAADISVVLTELAASRPGDDAFASAVIAAATDAVQALRDSGIPGLTVGGADADVHLVVDREALASALDALPVTSGLSSTVSAVLGELQARLEEAAAAPADLGMSPATGASPQIALRPEQISAAQLFLKALDRVVNGAREEEGRPRATAGALDVETRATIRSQVEAGLAPRDAGLGSLLDTLITNSR